MLVTLEAKPFREILYLHAHVGVGAHVFQLQIQHLDYCTLVMIHEKLILRSIFYFPDPAKSILTFGEAISEVTLQVSKDLLYNYPDFPCIY